MNIILGLFSLHKFRQSNKMKSLTNLLFLLAPLTIQAELTCSDSPLKFKVGKILHHCKWAVNKIRCKKPGVSIHCPSSCGTCSKYACTDTWKKFKISPTKQKSCKWVGQKWNTRQKRCNIGGVSETCRKTCGHCTKNMSFNRIATFPICSQLDANCNTATVTAADIVTATDDGMTLIYSDSKSGNIGFVDITESDHPEPMGVTILDGKPTSVAVLGKYVFAAVITGTDYKNPSGQLKAIDISTQKVLQTWELGGQPDCVTVSPDGSYIVIAIENSRDEDLGEGFTPQVRLLYFTFFL